MFNLDGANPMNTAVAERCYGKFFFSDAMLKSQPDILQKIFAKVIPLNVSYDYSRQIFEVSACSKEFEPLEEHAEIPFYQVSVKQVLNKKTKNKSTFIVFKKLNE